MNVTANPYQNLSVPELRRLVIDRGLDLTFARTQEQLIALLQQDDTRKTGVPPAITTPPQTRSPIKVPGAPTVERTRPTTLIPSPKSPPRIVEVPVGPQYDTMGLNDLRRIAIDKGLDFTMTPTKDKLILILRAGETTVPKLPSPKLERVLTRPQ